MTAAADKTKTTRTGAGAFAVGRSDLLKVAPADIHIKQDWNVREDTPEYRQHVVDLAESIYQNGVETPLKGYYDKLDNKIYLTNGHSRMLAIALIKTKYGTEIKSVPLILEDRHASEADRTLTLLTSNSGKPLSTLEQGWVYKRLLKLGWSEELIASKSGVNVQTVTRALNLQGAPEPLKQMIRQGEVSASLAIDTIRANGQDATEILKEAKEVAKADGKQKVTLKHVKKVTSNDGSGDDGQSKVTKQNVIKADKQVYKPQQNKPIIPSSLKLEKPREDYTHRELLDMLSHEITDVAVQFKTGLNGKMYAEIVLDVDQWEYIKELAGEK
jgi:ParB-like chromosome segregation protein Spo0J